MAADMCICSGGLENFQCFYASEIMSRFVQICCSVLGPDVVLNTFRGSVWKSTECLLLASVSVSCLHMCDSIFSQSSCNLLSRGQKSLRQKVPRGHTAEPLSES